MGAERGPENQQNTQMSLWTILRHLDSFEGAKNGKKCQKIASGTGYENIFNIIFNYKTILY